MQKLSQILALFRGTEMTSESQADQSSAAGEKAWADSETLQKVSTRENSAGSPQTAGRSEASQTVEDAVTSGQPPPEHEEPSTVSAELRETAESEAAEPGVSTIGDSIREIEKRIAALEETVTRRLREDETKEQMFNALYDELQQHRQGMLRSANKRLILALLILHDNLRAALDSAHGEVRAELQFAMDELLGVLYSEEVEPVAVAVGDEFNGREHRALGRVPTTNQAEDKTVDRLGRTGFRWADQILRPAEVYVRRLQPADASRAGTENEATQEQAETDSK